MANSFSFDVNKYMGTWYELIHYPSWFQRNDNYNTEAQYRLNPDNTVSVYNSTVSQGDHLESYGIADMLGPYSFRVNFSVSEIIRLQQSGKVQSPNKADRQSMQSDAANYVVDMIWTNQHGDYIFAVVTDPDRKSLYVLSRYRHPSRVAYDQIMQYVATHYDRDRLVQTPHMD